MREQNQMFQEQYASKRIAYYERMESLLNLMIHQNAFLEPIGSDAQKTMDMVERFVSNLTRNITFQNIPGMDDNAYLFPIESVQSISMFCGESTAFVLSVWSRWIARDFVNILGPSLAGLVHGIYSKSKSSKLKRRSGVLFRYMCVCDN